MRHQVAGRKLGRDINSRKALLNNLANSVFLHGQIKTTLAKAKFAQSHIEKIITSTRRTKLGGKRVVASSLPKSTFVKLINEIGPGFDSRNGGYTRIVKLSPRNGDNAPMARIELLPIDKSKAKVSPIKKDKKEKKVTKKVVKKIETKTAVVKKPKNEIKKK